MIFEISTKSEIPIDTHLERLIRVNYASFYELTKNLTIIMYLQNCSKNRAFFFLVLCCTSCCFSLIVVERLCLEIAGMLL